MNVGYLNYAVLCCVRMCQTWQASVTDIHQTSQTSYTTPCNGVVSHGAQFGSLQVFANHTRENKRKPTAHDLRMPCGVLRLFVFTLRLYYMRATYAPNKPQLIWLRKKTKGGVRCAYRKLSKCFFIYHEIRSESHDLSVLQIGSSIWRVQRNKDSSHLVQKWPKCKIIGFCNLWWRLHFTTSCTRQCPKICCFLNVRICPCKKVFWSFLKIKFWMFTFK